MIQNFVSILLLFGASAAIVGSMWIFPLKSKTDTDEASNASNGEDGRTGSSIR